MSEAQTLDPSTQIEPGPPSKAHRQSVLRGPSAVRVFSHVSIWTLIVVPVLIQISRHWRPRGDYAVIALGAYRVFSLHSPLVGVWTSASQGSAHGFYDVGPLLFWLLAIPVHLDPDRGALWGAALWCGLVLSATIEALWSMRSWVGCAILVFVLLDLAWLVPSVPTDLVWNPNIGLVFLTASIALAWVVANGSTGWWPLLVFTGSVAAQCHLAFIPFAVPLVLLAPLFYRIWAKRRFEHLRWLYFGIGVGVACWAAPLIQQVTGQPGNLSLLAGSKSGTTAGVGFGFRALSWAGSLHPVWLHGYPDAWFESMGKYIGFHSEFPGVLVAVVLVVIAVWAWRSRRMQLASLASIGVIVSAAVVVGFGSVPSTTLSNLGYLVPLLWMVGILIWTCTIWGLVAGLTTVWTNRESFMQPPAFLPDNRTGRPSAAAEFFTGNPVKVIWKVGLHLLASLLRWIEPSVRWIEGRLHRLKALPPRFRPSRLTLAALVAVLLLIAGFGLRNEADAASSPPKASAGATRDVNASAIERAVPSGPFLFRTEPSRLIAFLDVWGLAYQLSVDGRTVGLPSGPLAQAVNLPTPPNSGWPTVTLSLHGQKQVLRVRR